LALTINTRFQVRQNRKVPYSMAEGSGEVRSEFSAYIISETDLILINGFTEMGFDS